MSADDVPLEEPPDIDGGESDADLEALLTFVRDIRGFDFTGYKRPSVARRVQRRMAELGVEGYRNYLSVLEVDVDEFTNLFNTILINVTGFFRDPEVWSYVVGDIVPRILERRAPDEPIRIWSAGCASGEEPYTVAMILAEALGLEALGRRVKVYATDVDLAALSQARTAVYPQASLDDIPEDLRGRYFQRDPHGRGWSVVSALRQAVVFGRHDLTRDAPISRIDLLCCRNTLMYLNAETQTWVVPRLHYALADGGYLLLGRAEMPMQGGADRFTPTSLRHRIFQALPGRPGTAPERRAEVARLAGLQFALTPDDRQPEVAPDRWPDLRQAVWQAGLVAQLVIDPEGQLLAANDEARDLFQLTTENVGNALEDLVVAIQPFDLAEPVAAAIAERRSTALGARTQVLNDGREIELDGCVSPLLDASGDVLGVSVTFTDVSQVLALREEFARRSQELETAQEELQSTNEELVTSNEELQSTNEELETTNEQVQSANEELETINEELRSSNEEADTVNEALQSANDAVERINDTLLELNDQLNQRELLHRSIVDGLPQAVAVIDAQLLVEEWNAAAHRLWGPTRDEVEGRPFFGLDFGLPLEPLQSALRGCFADPAEGAEVDLDGVDRRGRACACRVTVVPLVADPGLRRALVIMAEKEQGER